MVADEGRFGRLGQVMSAWCGPGIRPAGGQQLVREYLYSFVAVAPALGSMTGEHPTFVKMVPRGENGRVAPGMTHHDT